MKRAYEVYFIGGTTLMFEGEKIADLNFEKPIIVDGKEKLTIPWANILFIKEKDVEQ